MQRDFYLNERSTAAYFEKDWYDHITRPESATKFAFAPFAPALLYCPYHEQLITLLQNSLKDHARPPKRLLEIGSSLGRTFYEICRRVPSVQTARMFEPSQNLWRTFNTIFTWPEPVRLTGLKGNNDLHAIDFPAAAAIRQACAHVGWTCENEPFETAAIGSESYDLVVCSNVIDQCHNPEGLAQRLQVATAPGGLLVLSCTYQWQNRYTGNAAKPIRDIQDLFGAEWKLRTEANIPFEFRVNERYWMKFLSHACVFERLPSLAR